MGRTDDVINVAGHRLSTDADDGLPVVAALVGAILLARATAGTELSEKILEATHEALTAPHRR
ncbi:hypothetical protein [Nocardiopsis xinjiangensis]|uniref:hypothetical protein n=1 Tax=Nocardiopsis xinjiangensis TaxID=124285 RepID=UPI000346F94B|nr:hypothetical protein [Nocardiopsis xinjiangensis]